MSAYDSNCTSKSPDARLAALAAAQLGLISRAQAAASGLSPGAIGHRLRSGRWEPVSRCVYRLAGLPPLRHQTLLAACLAWGEGAVASHRSAAAVWELAGSVSGPVELTVPKRRRAAPQLGAIVHLHALQDCDRTRRGPIPVTTPARTLIDLASVVSPAAAEEALDDALRRRLVRPGELAARVDALARSGRPGIARTRALLREREPGAAPPQSVFETRLLRALRLAGLPRPETQVPIYDAGRLVGVVDFAYPAERLAIEADGFRYHDGRARFDHDRRRRTELTLLGWRVLHFTWPDLERRPERVTGAVARALGRPAVSAPSPPGRVPGNP